jgi:hypothetical protein
MHCQRVSTLDHGFAGGDHSCYWMLQLEQLVLNAVMYAMHVS